MNADNEIKLSIARMAVSKGNLKLLVDIHDTGRITVLTKDGREDFIFKNSDPKMVREIGWMLVMAGQDAIAKMREYP